MQLGKVGLPHIALDDTSLLVDQIGGGRQAHVAPVARHHAGVVDRHLERQLARLRERLAGRELALELTPLAKETIGEAGWDPAYGARPLKRAIQRYLEDPLSEKILYKAYNAGELIVVDVEDDPDKPGEQRIVFRAIEGVRAPSTAELAGAGAADTGNEPTSGE